MQSETKQAVRPPVPDNVPTDGEEGPFRGTNPWSGPYFVLAIIVGAVIVIGGIAAAIVLKSVGGH